MCDIPKLVELVSFQLGTLIAQRSDVNISVQSLSWEYTHECICAITVRDANDVSSSSIGSVLRIALAVFAAINSEHNTEYMTDLCRRFAERKRVEAPSRESSRAERARVPRVFNETSPDSKRTRVRPRRVVVPLTRNERLSSIDCLLDSFVVVCWFVRRTFVCVVCPRRLV